MNIYDYAMKVEKDGERFYKEMAEKSSHEGLKNIFLMLAKQEACHYEIFKSLKENSSVDIKKLDDFKDDEKNIFEVLDDKDKQIVFPIEEVRYYEKAINTEDDAIKFYKQKALEVDDENEREILNQIIAEEEKHKEILENLLDYIQEGSNLVQSAEF